MTARPTGRGTTSEDAGSASLNAGEERDALKPARYPGRDQDPVIGEETFAYLEVQFGNQQSENADLRRELKRADARETTFKYKGNEREVPENGV